MLLVLLHIVEDYGKLLLLLLNCDRIFWLLLTRISQARKRPKVVVVVGVPLKKEGEILP